MIEIPIIVEPVYTFASSSLVEPPAVTREGNFCVTLGLYPDFTGDSMDTRTGLFENLNDCEIFFGV